MWTRQLGRPPAVAAARAILRSTLQLLPAIRPSVHHVVHPRAKAAFSTSAVISATAEPLISESLRVDCSASSHTELIDNLKFNRLLTLPHIEHVLRSVDRSQFIPPPPKPDPSYYYRDGPQPIGSLATIASPSAHCIALHALFPATTTALRCLDIGSGSGYLTLCLALLSGDSGRVIGIDHAQPLVDAASANVRRAGHAALLASGRLSFVSGNGMLGLPAQQPFDLIHCGAAVDGAQARGAVGEVAARLLSQLNVGGVLLIPETTTAVADESSSGGSKAKWSFSFRAASQSLNLYQRLPLSSSVDSTVSSVPPYTVRSLMHCSYSPMRSQPPPADIDSLAAFQQQTERLAAEVNECERRVKQWHERWKAWAGKGATEADRAGDAPLQALLQEWRTKSVQLVQRKHIEAQLQQTAQQR